MRMLPCVWILNLVSSGALAGDSADAAESNAIGQSTIPLEILFYDRDGLLQERGSFENEVTRLLSSAGIEVRYLPTDEAIESSGEKIPLRASLIANEASYLRLKDDVMGLKTAGRGGGGHVYLFYPAILRTMMLPPHSPVPRTAQGRKLQARAIARVLVHEIVHVVAPDRAHAAGGSHAGAVVRKVAPRAGDPP